MKTTVIQNWGGHEKDEERQGDQRPLEKDCREGEKQGRAEELECKQGGGAEQGVLVREYDGLMRLLVLQIQMMTTIKLTVFLTRHTVKKSKAL